jgi:hypothetical protein
MAHVQSYSHATSGTIPASSWATAWFTISSWKGFLQSFPGFQSQRLSIRALDNGDIRFHAVTVWDEHEQLEEWVGSDWSAESLLTSLDPPVYDLVSESLADLS